MKISLPVGLEINWRDFFGKLGYRPAPMPGDESYVRRLGRDFYPRFHVYVNVDNLNLHLDQKKASYEGSHAHAGEYDSGLVEDEGRRINNALCQFTKGQIQEFNNAQSQKSKVQSPKSFWDRIFG